MNQMTIFDQEALEQVKVEQRGGKLFTTSLNVAHVFGKEHFHVVRDIEKLDCSPDFRESNFGLSYYTNALSSNPNRKYKKYEISKDGLVFLVMGYTGEKAAKFKEAYIARFNEMERRLSNPFKIPSTLSEALQLAANQAKQLEEAQPKIKFYERVGEADGFHSIEETAKLLGYGRNTFFAKLREMKILRKTNIPYQTYIDRGYFVVKENTVKMGSSERLNSQTFVTGKGLIWLEKQFEIKAA